MTSREIKILLDSFRQAVALEILREDEPDVAAFDAIFQILPTHRREFLRAACAVTCIASRRKAEAAEKIFRRISTRAARRTTRI